MSSHDVNGRVAGVLPPSPRRLGWPGTVLQSLPAVQAFLKVNADKLGAVVETGA
jgi:hypothetical protein